ncbi:pyridoxal-phosphate-dependent aminotransferase family protein [Hutsoniella sourekii]|uniref:pyridoxal-phosphate-dependent aminotransferase family protein n=1 Tax=Hutsoniella sourekii TaxID=87650 RepID=UPI00047F7836|nr:alanine--glyoxylate aminotransferase family protein [Hutsoniella sourekii]
MYQPLQIPQRTIMTPGPVEAHPQVLQAMSNRILGQFDPAFVSLMAEIQEMLKEVFATDGYTLGVDGSSRSGLEAGLFALIKPGDKVLVPAYGRFAYLLAEIAERAGGDVTLMEKDWDSPFDQQEIIDRLVAEQPDVLAMIHGETANGQFQELDQIGQYCQENDIFFLVDMVATFGGMPTRMDDWGVDIAVAGTQKCISVPAGMSFVAMSQRAVDYIRSREQVELGIRKESDQPNDDYIQSNYLDLSQLLHYWSPNPINHHTEATSQVYGAHTGLRLILEEGLDNVYERHALNDRAIKAGIDAMGLGLFGELESNMVTVTPVLIPEGVDGDAVKNTLLEQFGVEIAGSFGPLIGKIWRIGNMGYSSRRENVLQVLGAFEAALIHHGADITPGKAVPAALQVYLDAQA